MTHFTDTKPYLSSFSQHDSYTFIRKRLYESSHTVIRIRLYENTLLISHRTHPSPHFIPQFSTHAIPDNQRDTQENSPHSARENPYNAPPKCLQWPLCGVPRVCAEMQQREIDHDEPRMR
jgi:hypothetical protein